MSSAHGAHSSLSAVLIAHGAQDDILRVCVVLALPICKPCEQVIRVEDTADHLVKKHMIAVSGARAIAAAALEECEKTPPHPRRAQYLSGKPNVTLPPIPGVRVMEHYRCPLCPTEHYRSKDAMRLHRNRCHKQGEISPEAFLATRRRAQDLPTGTILVQDLAGTDADHGIARQLIELLQQTRENRHEDLDGDDKRISSYLSCTRSHEQLARLGVTMELAHALSRGFDFNDPREKLVRFAMTSLLVNASARASSVTATGSMSLATLCKNPGRVIGLQAATLKRYAGGMSVLPLLALRLRARRGDTVLDGLWARVSIVHDPTERLSRRVDELVGATGDKSEGGRASPNPEDGELQSALQSLLMKLLVESPEFVGTAPAVSLFILLASVVGTGVPPNVMLRYAIGKDVSPMLAALTHGALLVAFCYAESASDDLQRHERLMWLRRQRSRSATNSPASYLFAQQAVCASLRESEHRVTRFIKCNRHEWCGMLDGFELRVADLGRAVKRVQKVAMNLLVGEGDGGNRAPLLFGYGFPDGFPDNLAAFPDVPGNKAAGFCFLSSSDAAILTTEKLERWAVLAVAENMASPTSRSGPDQRIQLDTAKVSTWRNHLGRFLECLLALLTLVGGAPPRASELGNLRLRNTATCERELYVLCGRLAIVLSYSKTRSQRNGRAQRVVRFPDAVTSKLVLAYLTLLVPMQVLLAAVDDKIEESNAKIDPLAYERFLLPRSSGVANTISRSLFSAGLPFGLRQYRQWQRGVIKHCLRAHAEALSCERGPGDGGDSDDDGPSQFDAVMDPSARESDGLAALLESSLRQGGHSERTATTLYGVSRNELFGIPATHVDAFLQASVAWHSVLGLKSRLGDEADAEGSRGPLRETHDLDVASVLRYLAESMRQLTSKVDHLSGSRALASAPIAEPRPAEAQRESKRRRVEADGIALQALQAAHGPPSKWKSFEQELSTIAILSRCNDVLVVLPTGGGKTATFLGPVIFERDEARAAGTTPPVTVLVVPLVALMQDLRERIQSHGLQVAELPTNSPDVESTVQTARLAQVVLVGVESASRPLYRQLVCSLHADGMLSRIVCDEAHLHLLWRDFRPGSSVLWSVLRPPPVDVPLIILSATVPPSLQNDIVKAAGADPECISVVRASADRPNLAYTIRTVPTNSPGAVLAAACRLAVAYVSRLVERSRSTGVAGRVILYCATRDDAERAFEHLFLALMNGSDDRSPPCSVYHGGLSPATRAAAQQAWTDREEGPVFVMAATAAFGTGVDAPDVRAVIHAGGSRSVLEWAQETGRAGRDGEFAECITLVVEGQQAVERRASAVSDYSCSGHHDIPKRVQSSLGSFARFAQQPGCRRKTLLRFLDGGDAPTCTEAQVTRCDRCTQGSPAFGDMASPRALRPPLPPTSPQKSPARRSSQGPSLSMTPPLVFPSHAPTPSSSGNGDFIANCPPLEITTLPSTPSSLPSDRAAANVQARAALLEAEMAAFREDAARITAATDAIRSRRPEWLTKMSSRCMRCMSLQHFVRSCDVVPARGDISYPRCHTCLLGTHRSARMHDVAQFGKRDCPFIRVTQTAFLAYWDEPSRTCMHAEIDSPWPSRDDAAQFAEWLLKDNLDKDGAGIVKVAAWLLADLGIS